MGWLRALTKDFILFCKMVQPSPSSSQLPSLRHRHRSCRPSHRPHPRPPPSLPSPLPSSLPSPLLTRQPCHCLHRLAALTLLVAYHPHRRNSRRRCHRPRCRLPRTTVSAAIIVTAVAARATGQEGEGPVQQCAGIQRPADSLRRRGGAAVSVRVAGVILLADRRRWRRWRRRRRADGGGGGGVGNAATK
jgi:hypothetical protein